MAETCCPDMLTPITPGELYVSLERVWGMLIQDSTPSRTALLVLLAHWALETGFGHYTHWYNLGNKKHVQGDGRDYTMFRCNEVVGGKTVWYDPPAPATWFCAYSCLDAGAGDYLMGLRGRFRTAWPFVLAGDVPGFCHALKVAGYYTADEAMYTSGVLRCFHQLDASLPIDGAIGTQAATDELVGEADT